MGVTHNGDELIDRRLIQIVLWCNGSTTDSGPVCQGSNPCRTTTDQTYTVAGVSRRAKISERAHSSAGLEHLSYKQRVIGSNPIGPTISSRYIITSSLGEFHSLGWGSFFLFVYLRHCFCAASVLIAPTLLALLSATRKNRVFCHVRLAIYGD